MHRGEPVQADPRRESQPGHPELRIGGLEKMLRRGRHGFDTARDEGEHDVGADGTADDQRGSWLLAREVREREGDEDDVIAPRLDTTRHLPPTATARPARRGDRLPVLPRVDVWLVGKPVERASVGG